MAARRSTEQREKSARRLRSLPVGVRSTKNDDDVLV